VEFVGLCNGAIELGTPSADELVHHHRGWLSLPHRHVPQGLEKLCVGDPTLRARGLDPCEYEIHLGHCQQLVKEAGVSHHLGERLALHLFIRAILLEHPPQVVIVLYLWHLEPHARLLLLGDSGLARIVVAIHSGVQGLVVVKLDCLHLCPAELRPPNIQHRLTQLEVLLASLLGKLYQGPHKLVQLEAFATELFDFGKHKIHICRRKRTAKKPSVLHQLLQGLALHLSSGTKRKEQASQGIEPFVRHLERRVLRLRLSGARLA